MDSKKILEREEKIIQFVSDNPYCSIDSIFTKGGIPKSVATKKLVEKLVTEKKINTTMMAIPKKYYVGEMDWVLEFGFMGKVMKKALIGKSGYSNAAKEKIIEFLELRAKVFRAEEKKNKNLNINSTLNIYFGLIEPYLKKPNKLLEINLIDILNFAIKDDRYYLTHQLHSNPKDTKKIFQKEKTGTRRSIETLIDMRKKGRQQYGLTGKDYRKNMQKMTNDPHV